ncbi:MAG: energy transducer TonB [Planctomycetota bacterium]|nr:MAG: energy transducer TonB [Planctomycetota bacterium]REJ87860.1 MAG: energy transducer TonB [Planctomycetota bacterium]REK26436.1 MAG: energy transducer TonB [Planctomycetota bacterium]REK38726.1 MAG: energy transducer TonB [Planctomycetota bacterium]
MFGSLSKFLTAASTQSVASSLAVHGAVFLVASWLVLEAAPPIPRLPGEPVTISVEMTDEVVEDTSVTVLPTRPVAPPVIVSRDYAIIEEVRYEITPTREPEPTPLTETDMQPVDTPPVARPHEVKLAEMPTDADVAMQAHQRRVRPRSVMGHHDQAPVFSDNTPPIYPAEALRSGWEGTVVLKVSIAASGEVTEVRVHRSSGHRVLDAAAANAVARWQGTPRRRHGTAIDSVEIWPFVFRLR